MATPTKRIRTGGSKFTYFTWQGKTIALANQVSHTSPQPVAAATPIQPLDERHPIEIITPAAASMGTLVLQIFEVWGEKVWDQLSIISGATDIVGIFEAVANTADPITVGKHVRPPVGSTIAPYFEIYHGCVIGNVEDGEVIEIGTMQVLKNLTINYTYASKS